MVSKYETPGTKEVRFLTMNELNPSIDLLFGHQNIRLLTGPLSFDHYSSSTNRARQWPLPVDS